MILARQIPQLSIEKSVLILELWAAGNQLGTTWFQEPFKSTPTTINHFNFPNDLATQILGTKQFASVKGKREGRKNYSARQPGPGLAPGQGHSCNVSSCHVLVVGNQFLLHLHVPDWNCLSRPAQLSREVARKQGEGRSRSWNRWAILCKIFLMSIPILFLKIYFDFSKYNVMILHEIYISLYVYVRTYTYIGMVCIQ